MGRMLNFGQTINQDECNTCTCQQNGQVSCTSNPNPCNCKYGTMTLAIGQSMKKDECNMCTCQSNGQVSCTNKPCSCTYNGNTYPIAPRPGSSFPNPEGCTCKCNENGQVTCDQASCPIKVVCKHMGTTYDIGATFKKECNTCRCQQGAGNTGVVACTKKTCGCREPRTGRVYKAGEQWQPDKCTTCTCQQTPSSYAPSCRKNPGCKV